MTPYVCSYSHVKFLDNFLRLYIHNPEKMFAPYVKSGMNAVDIGCGGGFATIGLAKLVGDKGKVTSVDVQPEMLEMVGKRAEKEKLSDRIVTHLCTRDEFGLKDRFDFVNAFWMVHEAPDTEKFLAQVRSLLKPDGKFFAAEPVIHVSKTHFDKMIEIAKSVGLKEYTRPKIAFSRAIVFECA